jgi:hypothetical protein
VEVRGETEKVIGRARELGKVGGHARVVLEINKFKFKSNSFFVWMEKSSKKM